MKKASGAADDHRLARLVRDGIVRPARGSKSTAAPGSQPARTRKKASALRVLLEDRRKGR